MLSIVLCKALVNKLGWDTTTNILNSTILSLSLTFCKLLPMFPAPAVNASTS